MTNTTTQTKPAGGTRPVNTKPGLVAALIKLGFSQDEGPFPPSLKTVAPAAMFTEDEMSFAEYMVADDDFGGCWNDAEQIDMHTVPDTQPAKAATHTPGPWRADKWGGDAWTVSAPDSHYSVCRLQDCNNAEANAALIAAAPALLAALEAAMVYVRHHDSKVWDGARQDVVLRQARAALALAEGGCAVSNPIKYPCTKKPSDPTFHPYWSGRTGAPIMRGKRCPKCGGEVHDEAGNAYCPRCDDYVRAQDK